LAKVLITGGYGLVGHRVSLELMNAGHKVVIVDNRNDYGIIPKAEMDYTFEARKAIVGPVLAYNIDICSRDFKAVMVKEKPDTVIHLASYPRQKVVNKDPQLASQVIIGGTINVIQACEKFGVKRLLFASSSMVYGEFEDGVKETDTCNPQGTYAIAKLACEHLVKDSNLDYTIVRPSAIYGELDVRDRVISKFLIKAMCNETLKVNGEDEKLDFTYVGDVAVGFKQILESDKTINKTYNLTKSHSNTLFRAAQLAISLAQSGYVELGPKDPDFPSRGSLDITQAKNDFDFNPKVDVEEGFSLYYHWLKNSKFWYNYISERRKL